MSDHEGRIDVLNIALQAFMALLHVEPGRDRHDIATQVADETVVNLPDRAVLDFVDDHPELVTDEALYSMRDRIREHLVGTLPEKAGG